MSGTPGTYPNELGGDGSRNQAYLLSDSDARIFSHSSPDRALVLAANKPNSATGSGNSGVSHRRGRPLPVLLPFPAACQAANWITLGRCTPMSWSRLLEAMLSRLSVNACIENMQAGHTGTYARRHWNAAHTTWTAHSSTATLGHQQQA